MSPQTKALPTLPTVALKLLSVMASDDWSIHELSEAIRIDPSLTSKLIRAANAVQRSADRTVGDINRAAILLGKKKVSSLALTFSLSPVIARDKRLAKYYQEYWLESAVQAVTAELLASRHGVEDEGRCFTAGLLQDLGRLHFLQMHGDEYTRLIEIGKQGKEGLVDLEQQAFGMTHCRLGADMLSAWGFPRQIVAAVAVHHECHEQTIQSSRPVTLEQILRIASLVGEYFCGHHRGIIHLMLDEALSRCPAPTIETEDLADQVCKKLVEMADVFRLDVSAIPHANALLAESLEQIAGMALSLEHSDAQHPESTALALSNQILRARLQDVVQRFRLELPALHGASELHQTQNLVETPL